MNRISIVDEMEILKSDENKTIQDAETDEMTPLQTELTNEGEETKEY